MLRDIFLYGLLGILLLVPLDNMEAQEEKGLSSSITLFLCGDVMLGRGIDQALPYPSDPDIYESYVQSAMGYLKLAQKKNGPIPYPVDFAYVWGDALDELDRVAPHVRIINLETSITQSSDYNHLSESQARFVMGVSYSW